MKISKLKELIDELCDTNPEYDVYIELSETSYGPISCAEIESLTVGFDWNKGKILIKSTSNLIRK